MPGGDTAARKQGAATAEGIPLNLPCEVCGQPITEWTEEDVRRGVSGLGWGHTQCWNTTEGRARQFAKLVREELERRTRNY